MAKTDKTTTEAKSTTPDAKHEPLSVLVGTWRIEVPNPAEPGEIVHGSVTFEWLSGGRYLIERSTIEHPDFPDSISVIGYDETTGNYTQHYFDSRGVGRIYGMSVINNVWKLWRDSPGFSQRFTGTMSDNDSVITGRWEKSVDGSNWEHDFDLTYRKSE
jgi:hypothetical protein